MKRDWEKISYRKALKDFVPKVSGLYRFMEVKRLFGLPINEKSIYAGKSDNLHRRFTEHLGLRSEPNPALVSIKGKPDIEFWFAPIPEDKINKLERILIQKINPRANVIKYKKGIPNE